MRISLQTVASRAGRWGKKLFENRNDIGGSDHRRIFVLPAQAEWLPSSSIQNTEQQVLNEVSDLLLALAHTDLGKSASSAPRRYLPAQLIAQCPTSTPCCCVLGASANCMDPHFCPANNCK